jgi:hypothetical protein
MFLTNKYTNWYFKLIDNAITRQPIQDYTEKHHIIPKCFGGINHKSNIAVLTAREHFICHLLLTKMCTGLHKRKMTFALWRMVHGNKSQDRYSITNRQYLKVKEIMAAASSEQNTGQTFSEERMVTHKNAMANRIVWNKGKKMSDDFCEKISIARQKYVVDPMDRQRISNSVKTTCANKRNNSSKADRPRFKWVLYNNNTGETANTSNLRQWCKDRGFTSSMIYQNASDWAITEKYRYKDNTKII